MTSVVDYVLSSEINHIVSMQTKYANWGDFLEKLSTVMSPTMILTVWTPVIGALDTALLVDMLLLVVASSFGSTLLKWVDQEPRPYWWINETPMYTKKTIPKINISPSTCETSSGGFSTHSAIFTVFLFVLGMKLVDLLTKIDPCHTRLHKYGMYAFTILGSSLMWASRMYLGTHFLHQCVAGSILGATLAYFYYENNEFEAKATEPEQKEALLGALGCSALVVIMYGGMVLLGLDLQWSTRMAFKWCGNPDYLKPTTTPVYSAIKDLGMIYGIAIASPMYEKKYLENCNRFRSTMLAVFIIAGHQMLEVITPTAWGRCAFLIFVFIRSGAFSYMTAHVLPTQSVD